MIELYYKTNQDKHTQDQGNTKTKPVFRLLFNAVKNHMKYSLYSERKVIYSYQSS